jgi:RHS repeat-associated protein
MESQSYRPPSSGHRATQDCDQPPWDDGGWVREPFTGKDLDSETSLQYFGARYYLAAIGRWGAVDPLADRMPGWSSYNYMMGAPTMGTDPDGRMPCWFTPQVCAAILGGGIGLVTELVVQTFDDVDGYQPRALIQSTVIGATASYGATIRGVGAVGKYFIGLGGDLTARWSSAQVRGDDFTAGDVLTLGVTRGLFLGGGAAVNRSLGKPAGELSDRLGSIQTRLIDFGVDGILDSGRVAGSLVGELAVERGSLEALNQASGSFSDLVNRGGPAAAKIFNAISENQVTNDNPLPSR